MVEAAGRPGRIERPEAGEYGAFYQAYVSRVPEGDLLGILETQIAETRKLLLSDRARERAGFRYAEGKWSLRQVVGHVGDTERVMSYRALRFSRGDRTPLPGFDENLFVAASGFDDRPLEDLVADFSAVRLSTLALFKGFTLDAWTRAGEANGFSVSVRALAYIIAGHELHHRALLVDRYLS